MIELAQSQVTGEVAVVGLAPGFSHASLLFPRDTFPQGHGRSQQARWTNEGLLPLEAANPPLRERQFLDSICRGAEGSVSARILTGCACLAWLLSQLFELVFSLF